MYQCPKWLDETAKECWKRLYPAVKEKVNDSNVDALAVLCASYSDYRHATDERTKKNAFDRYYKMLREFQLTPRTNKSISAEKSDELEALFE